MANVLWGKGSCMWQKPPSSPEHEQGFNLNTESHRRYHCRYLSLSREQKKKKNPCNLNIWTTAGHPVVRVVEYLKRPPSGRTICGVSSRPSVVQREEVGTSGHSVALGHSG